MFPSDDMVLLKPVELEQKSKGGIVIAEVRRRGDDDDPVLTPRVGRVEAFGNGKWDMSGLQRIIPGEKVAVGQLWQIARTADTNFILNGESYYLVRVGQLTMRFEEDELWPNRKQPTHQTM